MPAAVGLIGRHFERLLVIALAGSRGGKRYWRCACSCGATVEVSGSNLTTGQIKSCGCLKAESDRRAGKGARHGLHGSPEYRCWQAMLNRCRNPRVPAFKNYGGRGVKVCERWLRFEDFYADMGRRPKGLELDRIDNDGDYEPANCRWTTRSENLKNIRPRRRDAAGRYA